MAPSSSRTPPSLSSTFSRPATVGGSPSPATRHGRCSWMRCCPVTPFCCPAGTRPASCSTWVPAMFPASYPSSTSTPTTFRPPASTAALTCTSRATFRCPALRSSRTRRTNRRSSSASRTWAAARSSQPGEGGFGVASGPAACEQGAGPGQELARAISRGAISAFQRERASGVNRTLTRFRVRARRGPRRHR